MPTVRNISSDDITVAVVRDLFPPRRYAVCKNVSWGMFSWEADILAISPSGIINEVEVKVDIYDFRRDIKKCKWINYDNVLHPTCIKNKIHRFWYAIPDDEKMRSECYDTAIKMGVGLIVINKRKINSSEIKGLYDEPNSEFYAESVTSPTKWPGPPNDSEQKKLERYSSIHRLSSLRYWDLMMQRSLVAESASSISGARYE